MVSVYERESFLMNLIDMHCDTICELLSEKTPGQDLKKNNLKVDIEKLKKGGSAAQFFCLFCGNG